MKEKQLRSSYLIDWLLLCFKRSVKAGFIILLAFSIHSAAYGQQNDISGTVTDIEGEPLPGVTVLVQGTDIGTTTNIDGEYTIAAPSDAVLVFSFVGFITNEVSVDGRTTINITLEQTVAQLDELVVTGYTVQRRADITGSVSSVNVESIQSQTSSSILQRLDGQVAGVTINTSGSPGARTDVRIRGISSFQNNDPLFIVDGVPVEDPFANFLNANDVEDIQVLKDASAASIYGSRASNGVVIITTRQGQDGPPQVTFNARTSLSTPVRGYDDFLILDALEYHEVIRRSNVNAGFSVPQNIYGDPNNPTIPNYIWPNDGVNQTMSVDEGTYSWPNNLIMPASTGTNWWDEVFGGTAWTNDLNLGVSGGGSDYRYNVSFNYFDQEGTALNNRFQRGTIRVNTSFDVGNLTIGENISLAISESYGGMPGGPGGFAEGGILGKNILSQPVIPVYDIAGEFASGKAVGLGNNTNPVKNAFYQKDNVTNNNRLFGNVFARYDLFDRVLLNTNFGFDVNDNQFRGYSPATPEDSEPSFTDGINENFSRSTDWNWSNTLNYIDTFNQHNVNLLVGQEASRMNGHWLGGNMSDMLTRDRDIRYIQDALGDPDTQNVSSSGGHNTLLSFFGKIDYNYADRYHASFTLRRDGSSRLGERNRWGTFPAASFGWRISGESFMDGNELFSNLMLRAGWGITGNQRIPGGRTADQFGGSVGQSFYDIRGTGSNVVPGFRATSLGNPNLRWEENESINIGLDAELFEGRFNLTVEVYERNTDNLLFDPPTPATAGAASAPIVNIGKMQNRGIDFTVGYRATFGTDWAFSASFNGSHYRNEIVRIDDVTNSFFGPVGGRQGAVTINQLGHPIGSFYGLIADGLFQNQAEVDAHVNQPGAAPGRMRFVDTNGDGQITAADRTIIGDPHPDFTGGLNLSLNYRNWDFRSFIFGSFGNDIFDVQKEFYVFRLFSTNVRRDMLTDAAIVENGEVINPDAKYPRLDASDDFSDAYSTFYIEDGSYVRVRNVEIGYTLPAGVLPGFSNLRLFLQAENLFTFTGYSGLDPALPSANVSGAAGEVRDQAMGIDRGAYPNNRSFTFGVSATF